MFVGALTQPLRQYLGNVASAFEGANVVVGCSGNFTMETVLSACTTPAALHSNDVSLYSSLIAAHLLKTPLDVSLEGSDFAWLAPYLDEPTSALAAVMVLLDMLPWEKQKNDHQRRMWRCYADALSFKEARGIVNTATAVFAMCEIVEAWLKEHEDDPDVQA